MGALSRLGSGQDRWLGIGAFALVGSSAVALTTFALGTGSLVVDVTVKDASRVPPFQLFVDGRKVNCEGTPCVVSALGGLLDVVADGVEGLHVPPGDAEALSCALRRLLEDERLRSRLGAAGPAKASRFTLSQVLPRLDEVYLRVMAGAAVGRGQSRARKGKTISPAANRSDVVDRGAINGDTDPA